MASSKHGTGAGHTLLHWLLHHASNMFTTQQGRLRHGPHILGLHGASTITCAMQIAG